MVVDWLEHEDLVYEPAMRKASSMIGEDIIDLTDIWRRMNPFYPLYVYAKPENEEQYLYLMRHRMDEIRQKVAKVPLLLVESAYVRID